MSASAAYLSIDRLLGTPVHIEAQNSGPARGTPAVFRAVDAQVELLRPVRVGIHHLGMTPSAG
jgi:hypothetical protein